MLKSAFDYTLAILLLLGFAPVIILGYTIASFDTQSNGFFFQIRIGKSGKPFTIVKLKTIHPKTNSSSAIGKWLRNNKMDELPQLWNICKGEMSFVGPRPDLPGYYDKLTGENRKILELKPGITSEAALKYAHEEQLLAQQPNPQEYNDTIIFPDKVKMNLDYFYNHSLRNDLKIIAKTLRIK
jgi:lipopolysaccharide/colanic/teichoic acid biosynthesis glycosyltransferase